MRNIIGILVLVILAMVAASLMTWVAFWIVNGVMWLSGIGGDAILSELFIRDAGTFTKVIIYLLGFEWLYGFAYFYVLESSTSFFGNDRDADLPDLLVGILMTALIVIVYDPRIASHLPHSLKPL